MSDTTDAAKRTCVLCKKLIHDPVYECHWDKDMKKIVYQHSGRYCQKESTGPYMYMRRHGETKFD